MGPVESWILADLEASYTYNNSRVARSVELGIEPSREPCALLYGSHFLYITDFALVPLGVDNNHEHVDVKYTGERDSAVDMLER